MTRTSSRIARVAPRRVIVFSCKNRSSVACSSLGKSAISSSKIVPPLAASSRPALSRMAPVKAPFSCPKSSDWMRLGAIAPQLTAMNGAAERTDCSCTASAASSFPLPLSPQISTGAAVRATRAICSLSLAIALLTPTWRVAGPTGCCRGWRKVAQPWTWPSVWARRRRSTGSEW